MTTPCAHCPEVKRLRKALLACRREAETIALAATRAKRATRAAQGGRTARQPTQTSCGPETAVQGNVEAAPGAGREGGE